MVRAALVACLVACSHPSGGVDIDAPGVEPMVDGAATHRATVERITGEHRAIPGAMFGGWGPHLGHLVHASRPLWVDDLCSPNVAGDCDVNIAIGGEFFSK